MPEQQETQTRENWDQDILWKPRTRIQLGPRVTSWGRNSGRNS